MTIVLTIFALLVTGLFLSPSTLAAIDTATCSQCHGAAADFGVAPLDRNVCYLCHQYKYGWARTLTPHGWFISTDSAYVNSSIAHSIHVTGNDYWELIDPCWTCHRTVDCIVCHIDVPHLTHGDVSAPSIEVCNGTLKVCNGTLTYTTLQTCANSSCHTELPDVNPIPLCENCHAASHDLPAAHQSSLTPDCLSCHDNDLTIEHENRNLNCSTCHDSVDSAVQDAIAAKNTACDACHEIHGDITQIHTTTTDMTTCMNSGCHVSDVLTEEHEYRALNCSTCHNSIDSAVQSAISTQNTACEACHVGHGDLAVAHTSPANDCIECHQSDVIVVHNQNCSFCHANPSVHLVTADCTSCHGTAPHETSCNVCHGSKYDGKDYRASDVHMKHERKALCGICHMVAPSTTLEPTGQYCAACHDSPERYDLNKLPSIHKKHAGEYHPQSCEACHGRDVPVITPTESCVVCHGSKYQYDSSKVAKYHEKHKKVECQACHQESPNVQLDASACIRCHGDEKGFSKISVYDVHKKHRGKTFCDACHGENIPEVVTCASCHGDTPDYRSYYAIHKKHAGKAEQPCVTCHDI